MSISTERGDDGETDLLYGRRVSKTHPRVVAGGAIDELNAALGLVRVAGGDDEGLAVLMELIQRDLINLMGEVALPDEDRLFLRHDVLDPELIRQWTSEVDSARIIPLVADDDGRIVADGTLHPFSQGLTTAILPAIVCWPPETGSRP